MKLAYQEYNTLNMGDYNSTSGIWETNTRSILTNTEWIIDDHGNTIKTVCRVPTKKGVVSILIHRKMRGTAIWIEGGTIHRVFPIYVRDEPFPQEIKDAMVSRVEEDPFLETLPFPIYEEIMNYRINYCDPRSLADVIIEHMGPEAMQ